MRDVILGSEARPPFLGLRRALAQLITGDSAAAAAVPWGLQMPKESWLGGKGGGLSVGF